MRNYDGEYARLTEQIATKAANWRIAEPNSPDYIRTTDNWLRELERLNQVNPTDARVKSALELVKSLPAYDRPKGIKSLPGILDVLNDQSAAKVQAEAKQAAAIKALGFRS